jgi:acyl carrier protein
MKPMLDEALREQQDVAEGTLVNVSMAQSNLTLAVVSARGYVSAHRLRDFLWERMGASDAPDAVVVFDQVPRDGDGIDISAVIDAAKAQGKSLLFEPPSSDLEVRIASVWADVLELPRVSVNDDFMDLGGDSLSAVRILAEIEQQLAVVLNAYELLDAGTVRGLATLISSRVPGPIPGTGP